MRRVFSPLLVLGAFLVTVAVILAFSLGIGWLLRLIFHFSLFEGTLLGLLTGLAGAGLWYRIVTWPFEIDDEDESDDYDEDEDEDDEEGLPEDRFWEVDTVPTWEEWFRFMLADSIYVDLLDESGWVSRLDSGQQQDLAIRLGEAAFAAVRTRGRAKSLTLTREMLRQQMLKSGQRPYDDNLLDLAVTSANVTLLNLGNDIRRVARADSWDEPANVYWKA